MSTRFLGGLAGALLLVTLAACGGSDADPGAVGSATASGSPAPSGTSTDGYGSYVAIGDSYTAAPYVYLTDVADGCLRSNGNYPSLLAEQIGARLDDVSCSGADTEDLTSPQQTFQGASRPAQLSAVTADTRLVTVGLGGNDSGLFASLSRGCPIKGPGGQVFRVRPTRTEASCGRVSEAAADRTVAGIGRNLVRAIGAVRAKAPDATVVLVGYPRIASTTTTCPKLLPATLANARRVDAVTRKLRDAMRSAARSTKATFVDMYALSRGHDVCAGRAAWINGVSTDVRRAAPLHPFAKEQRAVALAIAKALA